MIITQLDIEGLGRHDVHENLNAAVVGLLGPNGAGKSTILTILKWLFTGETEDNQPQETYVRHWGTDRAPNNGSAKAHFTVNGSSGVIFRQAGKSPKRWLEWGEFTGKSKLTKAADVERTLGEILGADRRALAQAIFIPQGAMDKLFYGGIADREQLFTQLLLLSHMSKVENILDGKIKHVSNGLQDLTFAADDIAKRRAAAEASLAHLETTLSRMRDWTPEIMQLTAHAQVVRDANASLTQIEYYTKQKQSCAEKLAALLAQPIKTHSFESVDQLEQYLTGKREALEYLQADQRTQMGHQLALANVKSSQDSLSDATSELTSVEANIKITEPIAAGDLPGLFQKIESLKTWQAANQEQEASIQAMLVAGKALTDYDTTHSVPDLDKLSSDEKLLEDLLAEFASAQMKVNVRKIVSGKISNCPICDSVIDTASVSAEALQQLEQQMESIKSRGQTLRDAVNGQRKYIEEFNKTRARLVGESSSASMRFQKAAAACGPKPDGDLKALEEQANAVRTALAQLHDLLARKKQLSEKIEQLRSLLRQQTADIEIAQAQFDAVKLEDLNTKIPKMQQVISTAQDRVNNCRPIADDLRKADGIIEEQKKIHQQKVDQGVTMVAAFSPELVSILMSLEAGQTELQALQAKNNARADMEGQVHQARITADGIKAEQHRIADKMAADDTKRGLLLDLKRMRDTFTRGGLPMRFVRYKFERLAELTRMNLAKLEANFTVEVDPTQSVSFTFTRTDEPEPYIMPQSKLSGGQKVRLSVAFLMAVQQLIVPEVAFLVLDEPSLHLDAEGQESLKDLLIGMAPQLGNAQSQVWVCDHAVALEPAFGKIIRVK
jgi:DNA repair exonuclease SbcCD ATPase subunit